MPETHHYTMNTVISIDSKSGEATEVSDLDSTGTNRDGVPLVIAGTYYDKFSNKTGEWRFTKKGSLNFII
ncbi:nuclear transport factor 2 family protein [Desertibacillus haloalkaliphilus]|uniref:nuclear transport factor 2 family protein n=1 Tax=Desertibacillus haloalkaliphilus TaxID=1328930 RepID=UPI001C258B78|nr:nuclear transport factor 2 family protein [Desertibacillus haloalkaliphilus]